MNGESKSKDVLVAELLGELDTVIKRVDVLPGEILAASRTFLESRAALEAAGGRFKVVVQEYAEQAKLDFARQIKLQTEDVGSRMLSQQRASLQAVANEAFQLSTTVAAKNLAAALEAATRRLERTGPNWTLVTSIGIAAAAISCLATLAVVHFFR